MTLLHTYIHIYIEKRKKTTLLSHTYIHVYIWLGEQPCHYLCLSKKELILRSMVQQLSSVVSTSESAFSVLCILSITELRDSFCLSCSIYVFKLRASSSFAVAKITICKQVMDHFSHCYVCVQ